MSTRNLLNLALYQTGWYVCVIGAARGHPWLGVFQFSSGYVVEWLAPRGSS